MVVALISINPEVTLLTLNPALWSIPLMFFPLLLFLFSLVTLCGYNPSLLFDIDICSTTKQLKSESVGESVCQQKNPLISLKNEFTIRISINADNE